jgi:hypothetical protein
MKLEYTGDGEIRHGTKPVTKGGHIEVDDETAEELLQRDDFKAAGASETILDDVVTDDEEEE